MESYASYASLLVLLLGVIGATLLTRVIGPMPFGGHQELPDRQVPIVGLLHPGYNKWGLFLVWTSFLLQASLGVFQ